MRCGGEEKEGKHEGESPKAAKTISTVRGETEKTNTDIDIHTYTHREREGGREKSTSNAIIGETPPRKNTSPYTKQNGPRFSVVKSMLAAETQSFLRSIRKQNMKGQTVVSAVRQRDAETRRINIHTHRGKESEDTRNMYQTATEGFQR